MRSLGLQLAVLVTLLGITGCNKGISEGMPQGATLGLTEEQEQRHKDLISTEAEQAKQEKKARRTP